MHTLPLRPTLALAFSLALALAACTSSPGPSGSGGAPLVLAGTSWQLVAIDGRQPPAGSRLTLQITPERVTGEGGCNEFGGGYTFDGATGTLSIGDLVSTKRACVEPAANELEEAFLAALDGSTSAALDATGRLVLSGRTQLVFGRTA